MTDEVAAWIEAERRRVEARIRSAFAGVNRVGGVSWSESRVLDGHGSAEKAIEARASDTEASWESLVDDTSWPLELGVGGFNFLDPIGTRYYIAPAMIRASQGHETASVSFALYFDPPPHRRDWKEAKFALLSDEQRQSIRAFLAFMVLLDTVRGFESGQCAWTDSLAHYWGQFGD